MRESCDAYRTRDDAHEHFEMRSEHVARVVMAEEHEHGVALACVITFDTHKSDAICIVTSTFAFDDALRGAIARTCSRCTRWFS
jgi:hypothetical protein